MNSRYQTLLFVGVAFLVVAAVAPVLGVFTAMISTLVGLGEAIVFAVIGLLFVIPVLISQVRERGQVYPHVSGDSPCETIISTAIRPPGAFGP